MSAGGWLLVRAGARRVGLALEQVTAVHPVMGDIDLYRWVLFIAKHEDRHERQVRAIGTALAGEAAPQR